MFVLNFRLSAPLFFLNVTRLYFLLLLTHIEKLKNLINFKLKKTSFFSLRSAENLFVFSTLVNAPFRRLLDIEKILHLQLIPHREFTFTKRAGEREQSEWAARETNILESGFVMQLKFSSFYNDTHTSTIPGEREGPCCTTILMEHPEMITTGTLHMNLSFFIRHFRRDFPDCIKLQLC